MGAGFRVKLILAHHPPPPPVFNIPGSAPVQYQQLKADEHLRTSGKGLFKFLPFLQMRNYDTMIDKTLKVYLKNNFIQN